MSYARYKQQTKKHNLLIESNEVETRNTYGTRQEADQCCVWGRWWDRSDSQSVNC